MTNCIQRKSRRMYCQKINPKKSSQKMYPNKRWLEECNKLNYPSKEIIGRRDVQKCIQYELQQVNRRKISTKQSIQRRYDPNNTLGEVVIKKCIQKRMISNAKIASI